MPSIQIKNVPDDVHRTLRRRAAENGQSLQEYLLGELTQQARTETNAEVFGRIDREQSGGRAPPDVVLDIIRRERESR